jgi:hypothetical protein
MDDDYDIDPDMEEDDTE